ncbi:MAG: patatin-like phospholipase family protein [Acetobacteraceae bacterium]|jgi:hypothetical protein
MPQQNPPVFDQAVADSLFPLTRDDPPPGVFELGLVLGGTVSCGAWTAGALDFLLQALEAWHDGNQPHNVSIPSVGGASGGAICGAILSLVSRRPVPHITRSYNDLVADTSNTGNPFWEAWVNQINAADLLSTADLDHGEILSIVNCDIIDSIRDNIAGLDQQPATQARPYFPAPFRLAVTLANLRGIPYRMDTDGDAGWRGADYIQQDDLARFAIPNGADPHTAKRADEFWVDRTLQAPNTDFVDVATLAECAVASGSMPVGLKARRLARPLSHYLYRPHVTPHDPVSDVEWPQPEWDKMLDPASPLYSFDAVDGGTFNNDPITLVHTALAGLVGRNPRAPELATRALLMIDPLATQADDTPPTGTPDLVSVLSNLPGSVVNAARYLTADLDLMADPAVFSRFQLVPRRLDMRVTGQLATVGARFYAFAGFCHRNWRVHDFLLGRLNMQNMLRTGLILRGSNKLFDAWTLAQRTRWAVDQNGARFAIGATTHASDYFLPILPDVSYDGNGPIAREASRPELPWPAGVFDPRAEFQDSLTTRLKRLLEALAGKEVGGIAGWFVGDIIGPQVASALAGSMVKSFVEELVAASLLNG